MEKLKTSMPNLVKYFSDNTLIVALSKNNGDINKVEQYLYELLIENQNKKMI